MHLTHKSHHSQDFAIKKKVHPFPSPFTPEHSGGLLGFRYLVGSWASCASSNRETAVMSPEAMTT